MSENVSVHDSINEMYEIVHADDITNIFDRMSAQGQRCHFCSNGVSCQLCSNGPCRIIPGRTETGACGIGPDAMAMRNLLLRNVMGTSTYTYHAEEVARTLCATAHGKTPFKVADEAKLRTVLGQLGLDNTGEVSDCLARYGQAMVDEMNRPKWVESSFMKAFAPPQRIAKWQELGLISAGPLREMMRATSSCLTNVDSDYVSLAKKAMALGIACIYGAQIPLEIGQDILFGTPTPHTVEVDLGILDPAYVNILPNGHEPMVGAALIGLARTPEVQAKARAAGAKGLHIIGSIETGAELTQRFEADDAFLGMTGNWITEEMVLATGAVDVFATDMNCTVPSLSEYGERFGCQVVSVSELVQIPDLKQTIPYDPANVEAAANTLIDMGIANFTARQGKPSHVPTQKQKAMVGFSAESIVDALGGTLQPLLNAIVAGNIKGIVALVSCTAIQGKAHDEMTVAVARELVKRDILVLSMGCGSAALQVAGLCAPEARELAGPGLKTVCELLGVPPVLSFGTCTDTGRCSALVTVIAGALGCDVPDLPIAVTAPQYMEQKATIDALFALAFGAYTHVSPMPPVGGAPKLVKLLTEDLEGITGAKLAVESDPVEAVNGMEAHINKKRAALGI
jgi:carbon-monoxide dehydrogenase catalytic subunit